MGKKPKKISAKKMFITKKVSKTQPKSKNLKSGKIKTKNHVPKVKKVKIKKIKKIKKKN